MRIEAFHVSLRGSIIMRKATILKVTRNRYRNFPPMSEGIASSSNISDVECYITETAMTR